MKKRTIVIMVACVLAMVMALTACGSGGAETPEGSGSTPQPESAAAKSIDVNSLKTFGDVYAQVPKEQMRGQAIGGGSIVVAFENDGITYRAVGTISDELENTILSIDTSTEAGEKEQEEALKDLAVEKIENMNEMVLTEDEIKEFIGKTGEELLQEKWKTNGNFMLQEKLVYMDYGPYSYEVTFDGESDLLNKVLKDNSLIEDPEFDVAEVIKTMTVKSIENPQLSDAAFSEVD